MPKKKNDPASGGALGSLAPEHACVWCDGTGCKVCDDLGAIFSTVILRGLPEKEGAKLVIEGYPPVWLDVEIALGVIAAFDRATQKEPPFWFIREDGNQVYHYGNAAKDRARRSLEICELGFRQSRFRQRWLKLQDRLFALNITPERETKLRRILAKIDAAIYRVQLQMDALEQANNQLVASAADGDEGRVSQRP